MISLEEGKEGCHRIEVEDGENFINKSDAKLLTEDLMTLLSSDQSAVINLLYLQNISWRRAAKMLKMSTSTMGDHRNEAFATMRAASG